MVQVALDVRTDWNEHSGIPIHEMVVIERKEEVTINEAKEENPIDNQE